MRELAEFRALYQRDVRERELLSRMKKEYDDAILGIGRIDKNIDGYEWALENGDSYDMSPHEKATISSHLDRLHVERKTYVSGCAMDLHRTGDILVLASIVATIPAHTMDIRSRIRWGAGITSILTRRA